MKYLPNNCFGGIIGHEKDFAVLRKKLFRTTRARCQTSLCMNKSAKFEIARVRSISVHELCPRLL